MWTARAPLGGSRAAINGPSALRSARIGPPPGPAQPMSPTARPAVSPPSLRLRPAPTGSGTPGTHPRHPRSVPAPPAAARTHERAYDRRVSDFGSGLDFGIENWARASLPWSGTPGYRGIGRWDPPGRSGPTGPKLSACSDGIPGRAMAYAWSPNRLPRSLPHVCLIHTDG